MNLFWIRVVATLAIGAVLTSSYSAETTRKCTIKQLVGSVKIRRGATAVWVDARPKMPLKETDALRTFIESEAELETSEGTILKVGENSTVELSALRGGSAAVQNTAVKILNGAILANVKKLASPSSTFEFETPTATAAIRGTVVGLEVNRDQTSVKVYEGKVLVTPQGTKNGVELQQYQMGVVQKGGEKVAVQKFDEKSPVSLSADKTGQPLQSDSGTVKADTAATPVPADSDSTSNDIKPAVDTSGQSIRSPAATPAPLLLVITAPAEGVLFAPAAQVTVSGNAKPAGAVVSINGKQIAVAADGNFKTSLNAPATAGETEISITAEFQGAVKSVGRRIGVKSLPLVFMVSSPRDGQEFSKPLIPVSGTTSMGAEVTALSMKLPVTSSGAFSGQIPIANEAGDLTLEFEASLNGTSQKITRRVVYKPEYRFIVTAPPDRQIITATTVVIKGEVVPVNAEVSVNGKRMSVTTSGQFSGYITIPDEEGDVTLDFEIVAGGVNKNESRRIVYKKPPDTNRPQVAVSLAKSCWNISVFDRTTDEEITLWYETDGSKEFKTMLPNESFCLPLENGLHSYRVYAEDKAKNLSSVEQLLNYAYLSTNTWLIRMSRPSGNTAIDLPPASPAGEESLFPIEFSIENLPQDNMALIREIIVSNKTSGRRVTLRTFTDNFIATELDLVRGRSNQLQIDVNDINNFTKSRTLQINVQ